MNVETGKCYASRSTDIERRATLANYMALTKPRLSLMSVITALFGYFTAPASKDILTSSKGMITLIALFVGTALAAGGAAVLNQWMERKEDANMPRTANRPIPTGAISSGEALLFGATLSLLGIAVIYLGTNILATILIVLTLGLYLLVYTPMKKWTPWNTHMGAIPGALPPLVGWVAAEGSFGLLGWVLFGILFAWQMPHFMAICWMYKDDYIKGGFEMLSKRDHTGVNVARQALIFAIILAGLTAMPVYYQDAGPYYWVPAILLNTAMISLCICFLFSEERKIAARRLFFATLLYLPLFLAALVAGTQF